MKSHLFETSALPYTCPYLRSVSWLVLQICRSKQDEPTISFNTFLFRCLKALLGEPKYFLTFQLSLNFPY